MIDKHQSNSEVQILRGLHPSAYEDFAELAQVLRQRHENGWIEHLWVPTQGYWQPTTRMDWNRPQAYGLACRFGYKDMPVHNANIQYGQLAATAKDCSLTHVMGGRGLVIHPLWWDIGPLLWGKGF